MEKMTKENAREIEFCGSTLDECVNSLLKFQDRGESVFVVFNGYKLYSCDVTMDRAYQEVVGKTEADFKKRRVKNPEASSNIDRSAVEEILYYERIKQELLNELENVERKLFELRRKLSDKEKECNG